MGDETSSIEFDGRVTVVDHPLVLHKLTTLRDESTESGEFRRVLGETSMLLGYECMRQLKVDEVSVTTPLVEATGHRLSVAPVLVSILRAGNGLLDGILSLVPEAIVGFVGMARDHETLEAVQYYVNLPEPLAGRAVIMVDPMLATANTAVATLKLLRDRGADDVTLVSLVAAPEGIETLLAADDSVRIVVASVDDHLNERGYIVPGLGDAGDRIFGTT